MTSRRRSEKKRVEQPVCKHADKLGIEHAKLNLWGRRGLPDRIFFVTGGMPLLMEFKDPNGKLSALQSHTIDRLRKTGYAVQIVDNKDVGISLLNEWVRRAIQCEWQWKCTARLGAL